MALDDLWYLADEADQHAEQAYHRLRERHDGFLERTREKRVSRSRFRTLARRIRETGTPYGAHTLVYRPDGELLLVRHDAVDMWVLPGGGIDDGESFLETARRELAEEAGVEAAYEGLGVLGRVEVRAGDYDTWGVLPVYAARAASDATPEVRDPDGEISDARWFADLPEDTRDRDILREWRRKRLG
ncbi:MAG: NUDIX hydrolase [Haloglomus sp.]